MSRSSQARLRQTQVRKPFDRRYMITVAILAPRIGTAKAVTSGLVVFFVLALAYLQTADHFRWFR